MSIANKQLVSKGIDFQIRNNVRKPTLCLGLSRLFKIFCPTSWFILKQLDNLIYQSDIFSIRYKSNPVTRNWGLKMSCLSVLVLTWLKSLTAHQLFCNFPNVFPSIVGPNTYPNVIQRYEKENPQKFL